MEHKNAIERFVRTSRCGMVWMFPAPGMNVPKEPMFQRLLLNKIKKEVGVSLTIEELEQILEALHFQPTVEDPMMVSWVRRQPEKQAAMDK